MACNSPVNECAPVGAADIAHPNSLAQELEELAPHISLGAMVVVEHELHFQVVEHKAVIDMPLGTAVGQGKA